MQAATAARHTEYDESDFDPGEYCCGSCPVCERGPGPFSLPCEFKERRGWYERLYTDPQGRRGLADLLADELVAPASPPVDDAWEFGFVDDSEQDPCIFDCGI